MFNKAKPAVVALTAAVSLLVPSSLSAAQAGPGTATCDGADGVVPFPNSGFNAGADSVIVVGNSSYPRSITVSADIPAGTYDVATAAYDGYLNRTATPEQAFEQFVLEFLDAGGAIVATSGMSADLVDFVEEASWSGSVGSVVLDRQVTAVRAIHAYLGDADVIAIGQAQSVQPACFGVSEQAPPTTTTTAPTTTAPTTTAPTTTAPTTTAPTTTAPTTTVPTQVLPEVEEMPGPDPVVGTPVFTG